MSALPSTAAAVRRRAAAATVSWRPSARPTARISVREAAASPGLPLAVDRIPLPAVGSKGIGLGGVLPQLLVSRLQLLDRLLPAGIRILCPLQVLRHVDRGAEVVEMPAVHLLSDIGKIRRLLPAQEVAVGDQLLPSRFQLGR